jgi:hypothetical protein
MTESVGARCTQAHERKRTRIQVRTQKSTINLRMSSQPRTSYPLFTAARGRTNPLFGGVRVGRDGSRAPSRCESAVHDSVDPRSEGVPDGVYDLAQNAGWVSVGIDHHIRPRLRSNRLRGSRAYEGQKIESDARELLSPLMAGSGNSAGPSAESRNVAL